MPEFVIEIGTGSREVIDRLMTLEGATATTTRNFTGEVIVALSVATGPVATVMVREIAKIIKSRQAVIRSQRLKIGKGTISFEGLSAGQIGALISFVSATSEGELHAWNEVIRSEDTLAHEAQQKSARRELTTRLHARIGEFKRLGDEEGLPWSSTSEIDFWAFISQWPTLSEPGLILMDNGNLRAMWRNTVGEQVALEFRGDSRVYFVFFAKRSEGQPMARSAGKDSLTQIGEKIAGDNLNGLLHGNA